MYRFFALRGEKTIHNKDEVPCCRRLKRCEHMATPLEIAEAWQQAANNQDSERLLALSRSQRISDDVLHEIEREIDFEEARLPRG